MLSKITLFKPTPKKTASVIKDVHAAHKPSFFAGSYTGHRWRHQSMEKTLEWITDFKKSMELQNQAQLNLNLWAQKKLSPPKSVEVVHKDWGLATLEATKKHGVIYTVLNMANPIFPGGAALEGGNALEENMWHRSTCAESLLEKNIHLDEDSKTFCYNETARKLLEAKIKMTDEERETLKKYRGETDSIVYKVLFDQKPRVCFRGPEVTLTTGFDDFSPTRHVADSALSYYFLPKSDIFPFYELRSAAPELPSAAYASDYETEEQLIADLRRRVAAQLDTLILENQHHAILGAWGCGEFNNNPEIVAKIFAEEIKKRDHFFDHIVFPIINTRSRDNYGIFHKHLSGIELGITDSVDMAPLIRV